MDKLERKLKRLERDYEKTPEAAVVKRAKILKQAEKVLKKLEELKKPLVGGGNA